VPARLLTHWNHLLGLFPQGNDIYFSEAYHQLYVDKTGGGLACCFHFEAGQDHYVLPLIKRPIDGVLDLFDGTSAYGYGGPLSTSVNTEFIEAATEELMAVCRDARIICLFLRFHPLAQNHDYLAGNDNTKVFFERHTIAIDLRRSVDEIWQSEVHSKHRNVIRKARENGLVVGFDSEMARLDEFIALYNGTMDRLSAADEYYFSNRYFADLKQTLSENSCLCTVRRGDELLSACVLFWGECWGHYHLSCSDAQQLNLYPNNLMVYEAALYLKRRGLSLFHLGGGTSSQEDNTLLKFKRRFSNTQQEFWLGRLVTRKEEYEHVCAEWQSKFPGKVDTYGRLLQCYRY